MRSQSAERLDSCCRSQCLQLLEEAAFLIGKVEGSCTRRYTSRSPRVSGLPVTTGMPLFARRICRPFSFRRDLDEEPLAVRRRDDDFAAEYRRVERYIHSPCVSLRASSSRVYRASGRTRSSRTRSPAGPPFVPGRPLPVSAAARHSRARRDRHRHRRGAVLVET